MYFSFAKFVPPRRLTLVVARRSLAKIKSSPLTPVAALCQFKINLTLLITDPFIPFHVALSSVLFIRRRTSVLEGRLTVLTANCFCVRVCAVLCFFSPTSCTNMGLHAEFLGEIQSTLECPRGLHSKAELCGRVWEEKCNDLHLNGSTLANTMGLSFTGLGPPPVFKGACRDRALMRQQAFLRLVTNHCLHVCACVWARARARVCVLVRAFT